MWSFAALSRSNNIFLFFKAKTGDLTFMLTVYFLLVVGLLIYNHFCADNVENNWTLKS